MEFLEVGGQVGSCPFSQGHDPALAAFAGERDPGRLIHTHVRDGQCGEFADPGGGVVHEDQEHAVPARFGVAGAPCGQQRFGVLLPEVVDGFARGWFDTYAGRVVAQRGQCRVSRPAWSRNTRIVVILSMMVRSEYPRSVRIHSTHRPRRARSKCPKPMWLRCVPSVVSSHRT